VLSFCKLRAIPQFYIFHFQFYIPASRRRVCLLCGECGDGREEEKRREMRLGNTMECVHRGGDPPPVGNGKTRGERNRRANERKSCKDVYHKRDM